MAAACARIHDNSGAGARVLVDVPNCNADAVALVEELGMTRVFGTTRMYRAPDGCVETPLVKLSALVYGITTFELG